MADTTNTITNQIAVRGDKELDSLNNKYKRLEKSLLSLRREAAKNKKLFDKTQEVKVAKQNIVNRQKELVLMKQRNIEQSRFASWLRKGQDAQIGFNGSALSTLFFGMAIKNTFEGALKSIFGGYKKIIPASSEFNKSTTRLSANWEFFKFQLADALTQSPLFQKFIGYTIELVQSFQKLPTAMKEGIVWAMVLGAVLGSFLLVKSVVRLGLAGITNEMGTFALKIKDATTKSDDLGKSLSKIKEGGLEVKIKMPEIPKKLDDLIINSDGTISTKGTSFIDKVKNKFSKYLDDFDINVDGIKNFFEKLLPTKVIVFGKTFLKVLGKWFIFIDVFIAGFEAWGKVNETEWTNTTAKIFTLLATTATTFTKNILKFVNMVVMGVTDMITGFLADIGDMFGFDLSFLKIDFSKTFDNIIDNVFNGLNDEIIRYTSGQAITDAIKAADTYIEDARGETQAPSAPQYNFVVVEGWNEGVSTGQVPEDAFSAYNIMKGIHTPIN